MVVNGIWVDSDDYHLLEALAIPLLSMQPSARKKKAISVSEVLGLLKEY